MVKKCLFLFLGLCFGSIAGVDSPASKAALFGLLTRLDQAPVSWPQVERGGRRSDELARSSAALVAVTAPLVPGLKQAAQNSKLTTIGRLPLIGGAARSAQGALQSFAGLERGFETLIEADKRHLAPLRVAARAAAQLQRSRSPVDAPAVARSFAVADRVLGEDESLARLQRQKLTVFAASLRMLAPLSARFAPPNSRRQLTLEAGQARVKAAVSLLDARLSQLSSTRDWLRAGASEAQAVTQ